MIERFFRSLQAKRVWDHTFRTFEEARRTIRDWGERNKQEGRHQDVEVLEPGPIPDTRSNTDELISGQHDMAPRPTRHFESISDEVTGSATAA